MEESPVLQLSTGGCSKFGQAVSMPRGRSDSEAVCVDVSWPQAVWCMLRCCRQPRSVWCKASLAEGTFRAEGHREQTQHATKCSCLSLPAKVGVRAEMRKILDATPVLRVKRCSVTRELVR
jgi:hypothetical protein